MSRLAFPRSPRFSGRPGNGRERCLNSSQGGSGPYGTLPPLSSPRGSSVGDTLFPSSVPEPLTVAQVVLLPSPAGLPDSLTYLVPEALRSVADAGMPVLVPLGGREQLGYILSVDQLASGPESIRLKPIKAIPRPERAFEPHTLQLLQWLAREYRCSLADALPLTVPERHGVEVQSLVTLGDWDGTIPGRIGLLTQQTAAALHRALTEAGGSLSRDAIETAVRAPNVGPVLRRAKAEGWVREEQVLLPPRVQAKVVKAVRLAPRVEGETGKSRLGKRQEEVLSYLQGQASEVVSQRQICAELNVTAEVVNGLLRKGYLQETQVAIRRAPGGYGTGRDTAPELTPFQGAAADGIHGAMQRGEGETLLLFGVTGSGKTEVYLHAIERAREAGRTAALLVPEISLTAQVAAAVRRRLGERVAILHSALSNGERFDELERVRRGEADVVVGPRSALFAPLKDPALVILDEEHDGSYKQGSTPRYHARNAAQALVGITHGCTVLGSATPSVETYHAALNGRYRMYELPERVRQRPLPAVEIVDLRAASKMRPGSVFGQRLEDCLRQRLAAGE
ncbi:MAG: DEAD/DEAH box helicase, partial [Actinomycetota bacterium]